ncbi:MAG: hypothetical protein R3F59_32895 [Myxococcota bacterium]
MADPLRPQAAVPVLQVADVARASSWYAARFGFHVSATGDAFAVLRRGAQEIMLQRGAPSPTGWALYLRIADADAALTALAPHEPAGLHIVARAYGCREDRGRGPRRARGRARRVPLARRAARLRPLRPRRRCRAPAARRRRRRCSPRSSTCWRRWRAGPASCCPREA